MATVVKNDIPQEIEIFEREISDLVNSKRLTLPYGMNPAIFVTQVSSRKFQVGWHFEPNYVVVGDIIKYDDGTVAGSTAEIVKVVSYDNS